MSDYVAFLGRCGTGERSRARGAGGILMEVIGIIAVTLVMGYVAFWFFMMGLFPMLGFDEFHIPLGLALWAMSAATIVGWWFLVGTHLHLSFS